jgi:hypothetical protein
VQQRILTRNSFAFLLHRALIFADCIAVLISLGGLQAVYFSSDDYFWRLFFCLLLVSLVRATRYFILEYLKGVLIRDPRILVAPFILASSPFLCVPKRPVRFLNTIPTFRPL